MEQADARTFTARRRELVGIGPWAYQTVITRKRFSDGRSGHRRTIMEMSEAALTATKRQVWNAGRTVGAKRALKPKQIWEIRFYLNQRRRLRDRALFDLAIDSKLRGCDLVQIKIGDRSRFQTDCLDEAVQPDELLRAYPRKNSTGTATSISVGRSSGIGGSGSARRTVSSAALSSRSLPELRCRLTNRTRPSRFTRKRT